MSDCLYSDIRQVWKAAKSSRSRYTVTAEKSLIDGETPCLGNGHEAKVIGGSISDGYAGLILELPTR